MAMDAGLREKLESIECWSCLSPQADNLRFRLGQGVDFTNPQNLSPISGRPIGCCKQKIFGNLG
jgi:hypothetical protein